MAKEDEYKEMFLAEAQEGFEELNTLFTELEKDIQNPAVVDAIFRIVHTLKGNAMGMGLKEIAELAHEIEEIFNELKLGNIKLDAVMFNALFRANDVLGRLIVAIKTGETVRYRGIQTKLKVALRKAKDYHQIHSNNDAIDSDKEEKQEAVEEVVATKDVQMEMDKNDLDDDTSYQIVLSDMIQVPVRKLDELLNIVGELIIEKDTLVARNIDRGYNNSDMARLHRITSDLQYSVMDVRLVQVGFLFNKFHRILRDIATLENKDVDLVLEGTESEIDRNILKTMSDSLVHLVRNAVSHGIESPEERLKLGKPKTGKVTLRARNEKDTVFIDIFDDGSGIDVQKIKKKAIEKGLMGEEYANVAQEDEIMMCIFEPGFSSKEVITEVSGRGVGLDVVRLSVESIGGQIAVHTELGKGTTFSMSLPSSMAVKGALLFELGGQEFAIALTYTEAVVAIRKEEIHKINTGLISTYLGNTIAVIFLEDLFEMESMENIGDKGAFHRSFDKLETDWKLDMVIVSYNNRLMGIVVDKLTQQKEIVEKALPAPVDRVDLFSGATILGNGNMCLVLDVLGIISNLFREKRVAQTTN
jgi:two-component system chemotaxis sensor kinase CheA